MFININETLHYDRGQLNLYAEVGMYENSQKQGSYRRGKSGESCLKKN